MHTSSLSHYAIDQQSKKNAMCGVGRAMDHALAIEACRSYRFEGGSYECTIQKRCPCRRRHAAVANASTEEIIIIIIRPKKARILLVVSLPPHSVSGFWAFVHSLAKNASRCAPKSPCSLTTTSVAGYKVPQYVNLQILLYAEQALAKHSSLLGESLSKRVNFRLHQGICHLRVHVHAAAAPHTPLPTPISIFFLDARKIEAACTRRRLVMGLHIHMYVLYIMIRHRGRAESILRSTRFNSI